MRAEKLESLQILRGIAAVAVVFHHCLRAATIKLPPDIALPDSAYIPFPNLIELGSMGVDVFFILSGFLMIYISGPYVRRDRSIGDFLRQRLVRIWPLYAVATLLTCASAIVALARTGVVGFDLQPLRLASLLFVPSFNANGELLPILGVGWTLNYEVGFYLCFALVIATGPRQMLAKLAAVLALVWLIGLALPTGSVPALFLGNSILFEFLIGAAIGHAALTGRLRLRHPQRWLGAAMCAVVLAAILPDDVPRLLRYGIPAAALFIAMLSLEGRVRWPAAVRMVGDASYSLYLFHILVIFRVVPPVTRLLLEHGFGDVTVLPAAVAATIVAVVVSLFCYACLEQPLLAICKRLLRQRRTRFEPGSSSIVEQPAG